MQRIIAIFIALFIVALGAGVVLFVHFSRYESPKDVTIYFAKGSSLRHISKRLEKNHVIPNHLFFELLARVQSKTKNLKAGEYEFEKGLKPSAVLTMLVEGKVKLYSITIPEGFNLKGIGKRLEEKGLTQPEEWEQIIKDPKLIESLGIETVSLEGYLFPDTYLYEKRSTTRDLVEQMISLFKKQITPEMIDKAKERGLSFHQWVTLASIVEKETGVPDERPLIAAVFLNRIQKGMLLQTDPTVIYGIKNFDGNLTRRHLERDTPYNTYTRPGLPPGPIASPGLDSLKAVLNPANSEFLYFVSKGNGSHHFSKTLAEHNEAVSYYQLKRGNPPEGEQ